jgi:hypothetical protein
MGREALEDDEQLSPEEQGAEHKLASDVRAIAVRFEKALLQVLSRCKSHHEKLGVLAMASSIARANNLKKIAALAQDDFAARIVSREGPVISHLMNGAVFAEDPEQDKLFFEWLDSQLELPRSLRAALIYMARAGLGKEFLSSDLKSYMQTKFPELQNTSINTQLGMWRLMPKTPFCISNRKKERSNQKYFKIDFVGESSK